MAKDENVMRLLKKLNLSIEAAINTRAPEGDLPAAQCNILGYMMNHPEEKIRSTDVHKALGISRATVSGTLKRMRSNGYVVFEDAPGNDREKFLVVTEKARRKQDEMVKCFISVETTLYRGFTVQEKQILEALLQKMLRNLKKETTI